MGFVGQISFVDSGDIVRGLPGQLLLIFVDPDNTLEKVSYLFEWVGLDEDEPMARSEMPNVHYTWRPGRMAEKRGAVAELRPFEPFACHGVIYRTFDIRPDDADPRADVAGSNIGIIEGTKIGGIGEGMQHSPHLAGAFIASLGSIQPAPEVPYPWVNRADPIAMAARHRIPTWQLGDSGTLFLGLKDGAIELGAQFY